MDTQRRWYSIVVPLLLLLMGVTGCDRTDDSRIGSGSLEADELLVSSEVSGRIVEWDAEEGTVVEPDRLLGVVDTLFLDLQRQTLLSQGRSVRVQAPDVSAQTAALTAQISDLQQQRDRIVRLHQEGAATQRELERIETALAAAKGQLRALQSSLRKGSAQIAGQSSAVDMQVEQVEEQIRRSYIHSPIRGTLTEVYVRKGELAAAGHPLFRVADLSELTLRAYVTEAKLSTLQLGDTLTVQVHLGEERTELPGRLAWISTKAEFTPKNVQTDDERAHLVYAVKVRVPNSEGRLRAGMYAELYR